MRALFPLSLALLALAGCKKDKDVGENGGEDTSGGHDSAEDPFAGHDLGAWLSMEVGPDGNPAISAYDRTSDALAYAVGTVSGGSVTWAWEAVDSYPDENGLNPGDAGKYTSLAFDPAGEPWISYQDSSNGALKVAHKTGGAWEVGIADTGGGSRSDAGYWSTMAIDAAGHPLVAHYDNGQGTLRVARWNGTSWTREATLEGLAGTAEDGSTVEANIGKYAKLYVNGGTEYLAFYDAANGDLALATSTGGGAWDVGLVTTEGDVGAWPDIAVDGGTVYIAFQDVGNQDLKLATGSPGSWGVQTVDAGSFAGADGAVFVKDGAPHIAYFDGVENDLRLATPNGSSWSLSPLAGTGAAVGYHNEVASVGGTVYAACYDYTNRNVWFGAAE